jgi:hypothetical protein
MFSPADDHLKPYLCVSMEGLLFKERIEPYLAAKHNLRYTGEPIQYGPDPTKVKPRTKYSQEEIEWNMDRFPNRVLAVTPSQAERLRDRPALWCCDQCKLVYHTSKILRCSACKMTQYCGKECQLKHWPKHKETCQKVSETIKKLTS